MNGRASLIPDTNVNKSDMLVSSSSQSLNSNPSKLAAPRQGQGGAGKDSGCNRDENAKQKAGGCAHSPSPDNENAATDHDNVMALLKAQFARYEEIAHE